MSIYQPIRTNNGVVLQSSLPKTKSMEGIGFPVTRIVRGAVTGVYVDSKDSPNAVYADVFTYTTNGNGYRWGFVPRALVKMERAGLHTGVIWIPKASSIDISGSKSNPSEFGLNNGVTPASMDGDHVLVTWIDGSSPVIIGSVPHPAMSKGGQDGDVGQRLNLKKVDGEDFSPFFAKHRGSWFGLDNRGSFVCDTRFAHSGEYNGDGTEPDPAEDGDHGNVRLSLPKNSDVTLQIGDGNSFLLQNSQGETLLEIGDGEVHVAIGEPLKALWDLLETWTKTHVHATGTGPSAPPTTAEQFPSFDDTIISDHVSIPETTGGPGP